MIEDIKNFTEEEQQQMLNYLCSRGQLLNQIEVFDNLWDELMLQPFQVSWLRLLRINIRRLRSAVILIEPLMPPQGQIWLQFLRDTASELGEIREYDVAIKGCEKYEDIMQTDEKALDELTAIIGVKIPKQMNGLKSLLQQKRDVQCQMWLEHAKAGWISDGLDDFMEMLEHENQITDENKMHAKTFFNERLKDWGIKLTEKLKTISSKSPMGEIHKLRIKIKRYRYGYDVYMRYHVDMELLETLKAMQDMLGYVRDRERNISVMEKLVVAKRDVAILQEFLCYKAWSEKEINKKLQGFDDLRIKLIELIEMNLDKTDFSH